MPPGLRSIRQPTWISKRRPERLRNLRYSEIPLRALPIPKPLCLKTPSSSRLPTMEVEHAAQSLPALYSTT